MTPILFDTDLGSDIDDAVALAYLLKQPRCQLLGITTVTGDTTKRAAIAEITCRAGGREDIPIYAGLSGPILHGPGQPNVPQYDPVADLPHRQDYGSGAEAILFLRDTIRARPGEVVLLGVGPMTNLAALFTLDPEIPALLKSLVLMCGVYTGAAGHGPGAREWNALVDPVATRIVYDAAPGKLIGVGLDVTAKCKLSAEECRRRFAEAGGALGVAGKMAEVWFQKSPFMTFHDPLAAAWIFEPSLCETVVGRAEVHLEEDRFSGLTAWTPKAEGPHRIAANVNPDAFFAHYFDVLG
ncbi:MAG: nucleoside hydrolase [Cytophagales bacterium]|nr:nucleoside hydrolase [Armatimonadota bacterium]